MPVRADCQAPACVGTTRSSVLWCALAAVAAGRSSLGRQRERLARAAEAATVRSVPSVKATSEVRLVVLAAAGQAQQQLRVSVGRDAHRLLPALRSGAEAEAEAAIAARQTVVEPVVGSTRTETQERPTRAVGAVVAALVTTTSVPAVPEVRVLSSSAIRWRHPCERATYPKP